MSPAARSDGAGRLSVSLFVRLLVCCLSVSWSRSLAAVGRRAGGLGVLP